MQGIGWGRETRTETSVDFRMGRPGMGEGVEVESLWDICLLMGLGPRGGLQCTCSVDILPLLVVTLMWHHCDLAEGALRICLLKI
jgi:hypothetical protein